MRPDISHRITIWCPILMLFLLSAAFAQKGALTMGFNAIFSTRFGITVGYWFTDNVSLEAHFGSFGDLERNTYGLTAKFKPMVDKNDFYVLLGYAILERRAYSIEEFVEELRKPRSDTLSLVNETISSPDWITNRGVNMAIGYEFNIKDNIWRLPAEIGTFMVTHSEQSKLEFDTQFVVFEEDTFIVTNDVWVREPLKKGIFFKPLFGCGMTWYSRGR